MPLFTTSFEVKHETVLKIPKQFIALAKNVSCHTDPDRWNLLYQIAWRLTHGEKNLLHIATDQNISRALLLQKAVRRDIHKMHAFVRFRSIFEDEQEKLTAWYEPQFFILEIGTPFFARRFGLFPWIVSTPQGNAIWDKKKLHFDYYSPRIEKSEDSLDVLWKEYYRSIFNPARGEYKSNDKRNAPA